MMRPIGQFLAEFRTDGGRSSPAAIGGLPLLAPFGHDAGSGFPDLEDAPFEAQPTPEVETFGLADGLEAGAELLAEAPALPPFDIEAALAARDAAHAAALAEARAGWAEQEGAALAEGVGRAFAELEARLSEALTPILEPFLTAAMRLTALSQLRDTLATLLGGGDTAAIRVEGPADLLAALREGCGDRPGLAFVEADAPDVTIAAGDTRVRSQLRAWARNLESALGAPA